MEELRIDQGRRLVFAHPLFENETIRAMAFEGRLFLINKVLNETVEVLPDWQIGFTMAVQ